MGVGDGGVWVAVVDVPEVCWVCEAGVVTDVEPCGVTGGEVLELIFVMSRS